MMEIKAGQKGLDSLRYRVFGVTQHGPANLSDDWAHLRQQ